MTCPTCSEPCDMAIGRKHPTLEMWWCPKCDKCFWRAKEVNRGM